MAAPDSDRKRRGAWFTPQHLVDSVTEAVIDDAFVAARRNRPLRVLDPACGDGRFLVAAQAAIRRLGGDAELVGVDIDSAAVDHVGAHTDATVVLGDALDSAWLASRVGTFDVVIGNPPYLSQMSTATTRGGASEHGGGPYADAAAEFLSLGSDLVDPDGGRLAFVLPQSILAVRDAGAVRTRIDARATMFWSSWTGERDFDADVVTCAIAFEFGAPEPTQRSWSRVVTERVGVPAVPAALAHPAPAAGLLGDRATLNANFRDEYYGMIPAVGDHPSGPPLVTSGLIDPGVCLWGDVSVRFAKQRFAAPRIDVEALDDKMRSWASRRLVPKVLVANQTSIIEAVCDPTGEWLPGVPVVALYPKPEVEVWQIAAVLTSPAVSVWAWHQRGGSGLSATAIRVGPTMLAELAWPSGDLAGAVEALRDGDVVECGRLVDDSYGLTADERASAVAWWMPLFARNSARRDAQLARVERC